MIPSRFRTFLILFTFAVVRAAAPAEAADDTALHLTNANSSSTAYVRIQNDAAFQLQQFTLEAWIQRTGAGYGFSTDPSGAAIIAKPIQGTSGSNIASWHLHWTPNGEIHFNLTHTPHTSGVYLLSSAVATPNARHHLAVTFDGATIKTYIDGQPMGQAPWSLGSVYYGTDDVLLGADNFDFGYLRRFDGWIDDVRVWDHARSQTEIDAEKSCWLTGNEAGLVAYWTFENSDLLDRTSQHHDGSVVPPTGPYSYGALASIPVCTVDVPAGGHSSTLAFAVHPQPVRDEFTVSFELPSPGPVTVEALDLAGRRLARIADADFPAGRHEVRFTRAALGADSRSEVVFLRLRHKATTVTRPVVMLK